MERKTKYICFEGTEGCGKTTQVALLVGTLRAYGKIVHQTKEPGVPSLPASMRCRELMLDKQYDDQLTMEARELISQASRSITLTKDVLPALESGENFAVISDRGVNSGYAYGRACGVPEHRLRMLADMVVPVQMRKNPVDPYSLYDLVIFLDGSVEAGLRRAARKEEFKAGDAIEGRALSFHQNVRGYFSERIAASDNFRVVTVDGKSIAEVAAEVLQLVQKC